MVSGIRLCTMMAFAMAMMGASAPVSAQDMNPGDGASQGGMQQPGKMLPPRHRGQGDEGGSMDGNPPPPPPCGDKPPPPPPGDAADSGQPPHPPKGKGHRPPPPPCGEDKGPPPHPPEGSSQGGDARQGQGNEPPPEQ